MPAGVRGGGASRVDAAGGNEFVFGDGGSGGVDARDADSRGGVAPRARGGIVVVARHRSRERVFVARAAGHRILGRGDREANARGVVEDVDVEADARRGVGGGSARCGDVRSIATRGESAGRARALPVLLVLLQRVIHVVVGKAHARARPAGDVGPERRAPAVGVHARGVRRVARAGKGRIEQQRADAKPGRVFPHPRRRLEEPNPRLLRTKRVSHDLERVRREELRQNAGRLETGGAREGTPPGHPPRPAWPRAARAQRVPDRLCDPRELTRPKIVRASSHRYRIRRGAVGCALDGKTPAGKLLTTGAREVAFSHPPPTCLTRTPPFLITPCPLDRLRRATAPCASP